MSATLHIISSGSQGNNYILDCNGEKLIIELGVQFKHTLKVLNYNLDGVAGCCVSHIHKDHSTAIPNALSYGLRVFAPPSVCEAYPKCKCVEHLHKYKVGGFTIMPLKVPHGGCECFAYHIKLPDGHTILFATDLQELPYNIKGVNHLMLECNFATSLILDRLVESDIIRSQSQNHMELDECIATVKRLRHGGLQSITLIHLSDALSNEQMFKDRIFSETGCHVCIANAGDIYELKDDF